jgi:parallel beta-helix repeat protein
MTYYRQIHKAKSTGDGRGGVAIGCLAFLLAVCTLFAALAEPSKAKLACGSTVTKSVKLTSDVVGCHGVGLEIGADGITLDLNGHTVSAAAKRNPKAHGIFNQGHDRVTIRGGTVSGFGAYGVRLADANRNLVEDMRMTGNFTGVGLFQSDRGVVRDNWMSGQRFVGVALTGGAGNRVIGNQISNTAGAGIFVQPSHDETGRNHRIDANQLSANGILVFPGPRATRLVGNSISAAPGDGIAVFEPSTVLTGNSVTGSVGRDVFTPNGGRAY